MGASRGASGVSGTTTAQQGRPQPVTLAVTCSAINAIAGIIYSAAWPNLDQRGTTLVVSLVLGTIIAGAAWFLWGGARWGAIAVVAVSAFNLLLGLPVYFTGEAASMIVAATFSIVLSALVIAFVFAPSARTFWGSPERAQAT
jgi:hypothetical protein